MSLVRWLPLSKMENDDNKLGYWKYYQLDEELLSSPKDETDEKPTSDPYDTDLEPIISSIPKPPPPPNIRNIDDSLLRELGPLSFSQLSLLIDSLSNSAKQEFYQNLSKLKHDKTGFFY